MFVFLVFILVRSWICDRDVAFSFEANLPSPLRTFPACASHFLVCRVRNDMTSPSHFLTVKGMYLWLTFLPWRTWFIWIMFWMKIFHIMTKKSKNVCIVTTIFCEIYCHAVIHFSQIVKQKVGRKYVVIMQAWKFRLFWKKSLNICDVRKKLGLCWKTLNNLSVFLNLGSLL